MSHNLKKMTVFVFIAHLFCLGGFAQTKEKSTQELFAELKVDEKLVAKCRQEAIKYQIVKFGKILPKISRHCWDGCPISIVLPNYSSVAKQFRLSGQVKVETIVDETGKVIYARAVSGQPFLRQAAERAARVSSYQPKRTCDDKPIKFLWTINYNFILN